MDTQEWRELISADEIPIVREKLIALSLLGIDSSEVFFNLLFYLYQRAGRLGELGIETAEQNFLDQEISLIDQQTLTKEAKELLTLKRRKEVRRKTAIRLFQNPKSICKDPIFNWAKKVLKGKVRILTFFDLDFPQKLLEIPDPPSVLYLRGNSDLLNAFSITIVGTRKASQEGLHTADEIAFLLAKKGAVIVSGLALGIDGAAHRGAIRAKGKTLAVLPCGIDRIYPTAHEKLAIAILRDQGAILSEFSPKCPPLKIHFHQRNRLISGLSMGTIVVEADQKSGTMITSHCAANQGRDVFAVPGSIYRPTCRGSNQLIKDGARLLTLADDIYQAYPEFFNQVTEQNENHLEQSEVDSDLSEEEKTIFSQVIHEALTPDELLEKTGFSMGVLWKTLTLLQMKKWIFQGEDGRFFPSK